MRESGLRFIRSASAPMPQQLIADIESAFGVPFIEAYGMTEAAPQIASNRLPPFNRKPGSVGTAAGPEVAIMDQAGRILADRQHRRGGHSRPQCDPGATMATPLSTRPRSPEAGSGRATWGISMQTAICSSRTD